MNIFRSKPKSDLLQECNDDTVRMLELGHEMFELVTTALVQDSPPEDVKTIKKMDKEMNRLHRDVRRKVYEHLSLTGTRDLYNSLLLLSVVDGAERVGDYDKNIAEIITIIPRRLDFGEYTDEFNLLWKRTNQFFDATISAFRDDDEAKAQMVLENYGAISDTCDDMIDEILAGESEMIKRDLVALMMLVRFFKRVNAHLKNIASTITNPFHQIGYRPKKKKKK